MIYTVNYTKANSFMRHKSEPRLIQKNAQGEVVNESRYVKPGISKAIKVYVPKVHYRKNTMQVALSQKELDKLVVDMELYDDQNRLIESAPLRNPSAPFWNHPEMKIMLETSGTTLDDSNPRDRFWLACFEADPHFRFAGEDMPPSVASRVQFTVTKGTEQFDEAAEKQDEVYEATKKLIKIENDYDKMVSILRAMGTDVRKGADPKTVRQSLQRKITDYKDAFVKGTSERNIEMFNRLVDGGTEEIHLKALINQARARDIIGKKSNGKYVYGDVELGSSVAKVEAFLKDSENNDILNEIIEQTKE